MKRKALQTHKIDTEKVLVDNHKKVWYSNIKSSNTDLKKGYKYCNTHNPSRWIHWTTSTVFILSRFSEKIHNNLKSPFPLFEVFHGWLANISCKTALHIDNFTPQTRLND